VIRSDLARTFTPRRGLETLNGNSAASFRIPRNLTTGTFNLVVKDRFAFPPERRVFSPGELTKVNPTVPETFRSAAGVSTWRVHRISTKTLSAISLQQNPSTSFLVSVATRRIFLMAESWWLKAAFTQQNTSSFPAPAPYPQIGTKTHFSARAESEDALVKKRSYGGSY